LPNPPYCRRYPEIYSASPSHRRECTYYIAVGYYKLRNYTYAKKFNGEKLELAAP